MKRCYSQFALVVVALAAMAFAGCDSSQQGAGGSDMDAFASQMDQSKQAAQAKAEAEARAAEEKQAKAAEEAARREEEAAKLAAEQAAAQAAAQPAPNNALSVTITVNNPEALLNNPAARAEAERLTAGGATVGQGGSYYDAIIGANRSIRNRADDLAWTQAVQHYKANTGHLPKTHKEFMTGVIEAFEIPLEPLEEGQEYLYVPSEGDFGTLYIVEPRPPQSAPQPATPPATEAVPR